MPYDIEKTSLAIALAGSLLAGSVAYAYEPVDALPNLSGYPTRLLVDGLPVEGAAPLYAEDQVLFPLRAIAEGGDYTVLWEEASRRITLDGEKNDYQIDTASGTLFQDGKELFQDDALRIQGGSTYVSPELFGHVAGVDAAWDGATNTAVEIGRAHV